MPFSFRVDCTDGPARAGSIDTPHGCVPTPAFMPVATQGSVKAVAPDDLTAMGTSIVLSNTYHLMLRPGIRLIHDMGGLHGFMGWHGPILTDSGGFQTLSLGRLNRITDEGVTFRSHVDGSERFLSPELSVEYQEMLGTDIAMVLDHCPAYGVEEPAVRDAMARTHRWALRCRERHRLDEQAQFAVVQGGVSRELRLESAAALVAMEFDGYAVGGLSVGEPKEMTYETASLMGESLPGNKPRYLMGAGSPEDLVTCIGLGMDMFDCSLPTRVARNGGVFTPYGRVNVYTAPFREREGPIDDGCDCYACSSFPAAYLHHLFRARELLAYRLASVHNLRFVMRLMEEARAAIVEGRYAAFRDNFLARYRATDDAVRFSQKEKWLRRRWASAPM